MLKYFTEKYATKMVKEVTHPSCMTRHTYASKSFNNKWFKRLNN